MNIHFFKLQPYFLAGLFFLSISCKKMISVPSPNTIITGNLVFQNDATATSAVVAIYGEMMNGPTLFSSAGLTLYGGLCADELFYYTPGPRDEFQKNEIGLSGQGIIENNFWIPAYRFIYAANSCIAGIENSTGMSTEVKQLLLGEAKFIRAFCHFYLVNLFGDVPLITSGDYKINLAVPRISTADVYDQIVRDLTDAVTLLPEAYISTDRIRPNKWTAAGLLARVQLYRNNWQQAEINASAVISSGNYLLTNNLSQVFLKTNKETIWQLQGVNPSLNTQEAPQILPATTSSVTTYLLTQGFFNAFTTGDLRKTNWTNSRTYSGQTLYYPYKYRVYGNNAPVTENYIVMRLAEMYLIRAEARANLGNLSGALTDVNMIRNRAGLPNATVNILQPVLSEIETQRKFELFSEWGHRWLDLKRTNRADSVLGLLKSGTWQGTDVLWPIPNGQILANPLLIQNPGY